MHIAVHRRENDLSFRIAFRLLEKLLDVFYRFLHCFGGLQHKRYLLNAQVAHGYLCDDPWRDLELRVERMGLPVADVVAMMTAADVDRVVAGQAEGDQFRLQGKCSACRTFPIAN